MRLVFWSFLIVLGALPAAARAEVPPPSDVGEAYEDEAVSVRTLRAHPEPRVDKSPGTRWEAFQGRSDHPIDDEAFFRIVGCEDLVRRQEHRLAVKTCLTLGGWALIAGGAGLFTWTALQYRDPPQSSGSTKLTSVAPLVSLASVVAGIVSVAVSHNLDPAPIDATEADTLARDYDRSLRARLGLSETASRP